MILTHVSCFSGIGGMDLAAEWAGFRTILQIEKDLFNLKILTKHWPKVKKLEDIRYVTSNTLGGGGNMQPTVLSGGFPCQPFSTAGKRQGKDDDRYLWPEMLRLVQELQPAWVIGENVAGIVSLALDQVLADLEGAGYSCRTFIVPAAGVNAPHIRERVFIVAYSESERSGKRRLSQREEKEIPMPEIGGKIMADSPIKGSRGLPIQPGRSRQTGTNPIRSCEDVADPYNPQTTQQRKHSRKILPKPETERFSEGSCHVSYAGVPGLERAEQHGTYRTGTEEGETCTSGTVTECSFDGGRFWAIEPGICRISNGTPNRVDRLRSLGNAVVPQQVYPFFAAIAAIERDVK